MKEDTYQYVDMEPKKDSIIFYASWHKWISTLKPRTEAKAYKALFQYGFFGIPIPYDEFSASEYATLLTFIPTIDKNKRSSDNNWLKWNVRVCKELKQKYGLTFGDGKSQTRTERLRPNERMRYEMASDVKSALKDSHSWKDFSNNLKAYGINAQIKFRSGTRIPQGISFTRDGTTFKGSSLDRSLSFSKIDKILTGGVNIDTGSQVQDHSVHESSSNAQDNSMATDLSMLAADLAIGLIASGQEKKSEEQDLAPNKKRGPKL